MIGKPVAGATGALTSARRIAQREDRAVFACIKNTGLKRLDDEDIVSLAGTKTQGVRRQAKRVFRTLQQAVFANLRQGSQRRVIATASVLTVVADLAKEKSLRQVEAVASGRADQLPIRETLPGSRIIPRDKAKRGVE